MHTELYTEKVYIKTHEIQINYTSEMLISF